MACLRTYIYGGCVAVGGLLWTRGRDGVSRRVERKAALRPTQDGPLPTRGRHFLLPAPPPRHPSDAPYAGTVERLGAGLYSFSATGAGGAHTAAATTLLVAATRTAAVPAVPRCCGRGRGEYAVVARGLRGQQRPKQQQQQQQQRRWHSSGRRGGEGGTSMLLRAYLTSAAHYQVIFARDAPFMRGGVCSAGYTSPPMLVSILGVALEVAQRHRDCAAEADRIWRCGRCGVHNGGGRASCLRCGSPVAAASAATARIDGDARFLLLAGVPADAAATALSRMLRDATTPAGAAPVVPVGVRVMRASGWEGRGGAGRDRFTTVHARVEYATAAEARRALVRFKRAPRLLAGACGRRGKVSARLVRTGTGSAAAGAAAAGGDVLERLRVGGLAEEGEEEAAAAAAAAGGDGDDEAGHAQFDALAKRVERGATAADVESLRKFLVVSSSSGKGAGAEQVLRRVEEESGVAAVEVLHRGGVAGGAASCVVRFGSADDAERALRMLSGPGGGGGGGSGGGLAATQLPLLRSVTAAAALEEEDARRSRESMEEVAGILEGFGDGDGGGGAAVAAPATTEAASAASAASEKATHRLGFVAALTAEEDAALLRRGGEEACRAFFNDALRPHGVAAVDAQPQRGGGRLHRSFVLTFASPRAAAHARAVLQGDVSAEIAARQIKYLPDEYAGHATAHRLAATARVLTQPEGPPSPAGEEDVADAAAAAAAEEGEEEDACVDEEDLLESCDVAVEVTSPVGQLRSQEALVAYVREVLSAYAKQRGARDVVRVEAEVVSAAAEAASASAAKGGAVRGDARTHTRTVLVTCAQAEQTTPLLRYLGTAAVAASWHYVSSARRYSAEAEAAAAGVRALAAARDEAVRARTLWVDASTAPSRLPVAALRMADARGGAGAGRFAALSSIRVATGGREPVGLSAVPARFPKAHPPGLLVRFATAEEREAAELELGGAAATAAVASPPQPPPQRRPAPAMDESDDVASAVREVLEAVGAAAVRERQPLRPPRGAATGVPRGAVTLRDAADAVAIVCHRADAVRGAVAPVGPEAEEAAEQEREAEHAAHPAYVEHLRRVAADPTVRLFVGKRALWERLLPEHEPGPCAVLRDHAAILAGRGKKGYLRALHVTTLLTRSSLLWQEALCVGSIRYMLLPESAIAGVVRYAGLAERMLARQGETLSFPFYCALFRALRSVSPTRWLHLYARFRDLLSSTCDVHRTRRAAGTDIAGYLYDGPFITKTVASRAAGVGGGVRSTRRVCVTPDVSAAYAQLFSAAGRTHGERFGAREQVWARFLPLLPSMLRRDFEALGLVVQKTHARRHFAALADLGQFKRCVELVDWGGPGGGWRLSSSEGSVPVSLAAATRSMGDLRELMRLLGEDRGGFAPSAVFYKSLGRAARVRWDPPASEAFVRQCAAHEMECEAAGRPGGRRMPREAPRTAAMTKTTWIPI